MNGVILINKPKGYTSRDIVNIISKKLNNKKIGHFGTLDPLAEGLLIIGIGPYTKIGNFLENDTKEYIAEVLVGTSTTTYDLEGEVIKQTDDKIKKEELKKVLKEFIKTYDQEVPIYSATKVDGRKLYEYARNNKDIKLPKKEVTIYNIELLDIYEKDNKQCFKIKTTVSKGTYIRSLINDISRQLNIPLCLSYLQRTKQDKFSLEDANTLKDIEQNKYKLLNIRDIITIKEVEVPKTLETKVLNGTKIDKIYDEMVLFTKNKEPYVIYKPHNNEMKPALTLKKDE